jgi:hypothetical protein
MFNICETLVTTPEFVGNPYQVKYNFGCTNEMTLFKIHYKVHLKYIVHNYKTFIDVF